jgi:hypothetical protein
MRQRKILQTWSRARFSLYEVQEVSPGTGVRVKDLLAGGEMFVNDVRTSNWAVLWDCFLARVEDRGLKPLVALRRACHADALNLRASGYAKACRYRGVHESARYFQDSQQDRNAIDARRACRPRAV